MFCGLKYYFLQAQHLQQTPPKDCHFQALQRIPLGRTWGLGISKIFCKDFQKKKKFPKKLFFSSQKKSKKLIFSPPPPSSLKGCHLGFPEKKSGNPWGGRVYCKYLTKKVSDTFPSAYFFRERTAECQKNFSLGGGVPKCFFSKVLRCFSDKKNKL